MAFQKLISNIGYYRKRKDALEKSADDENVIEPKRLGAKRTAPEGGLRREKLLEKMTACLPQNLAIDFSSWTYRELENLLLVQEFLSDLGDDFLEKFFSMNFRALLQASSVFMQVIRKGDMESIRRELKIWSEAVPAEELSEADSYKLPENLRVIIIGGGRVSGTQDQFIQAIRAMGPDEVLFLDADSNNRIDSASKRDDADCLIIVIASATSHGLKFKLEKRRNVIFIWNLNRKNFQREVSRKFKRISKEN